MKKYYYLLALIILVLFVNILFVNNNLNYSPVPTRWGVAIDYGRYNILKEGNLYKDTEQNLTWQSGLVTYGDADELPKILSAIINIVSGYTIFPKDLKFHQIFLWLPFIFIPIIAMYWYKYISQRKEFDLNSFVLCGFSMFALPGALSVLSKGIAGAGGNSVARGLFFLVLVLLIVNFNEKKKNVYKLFVLILLFGPFYLFYHTWSYYLIIYMSTVLVLLIFNKEERYFASLVVVGIVIFISVSIYYNIHLVNESARLVKYFPEIAANLSSIFPWSVSGVEDELVGYKPLNNIYGYTQVLISLFLVFVVVIFLLNVYVRKKKKYKFLRYEKMLVYLVLAHVIGVGLGLFVWDGFSGVVARFFEGWVYIAILTSGCVLTLGSKRMVNITRYVLIGIICLTIASYFIQPKELDRSLTREEFIGLKFTGEKVNPNSYIFSDFRLVMPLLYYGQHGLVDIDYRHRNGKVVQEILERCYYTGVNSHAILDEVIGHKHYYVATSERQSKVVISDSSYVSFKPANSNFQEQFAAQSSFNKIYNSKLYNLFYR